MKCLLRADHCVKCLYLSHEFAFPAIPSRAIIPVLQIWKLRPWGPTACPACTLIAGGGVGVRVSNSRDAAIDYSAVCQAGASVLYIT